MVPPRSLRSLPHRGWPVPWGGPAGLAPWFHASWITSLALGLAIAIAGGGSSLAQTIYKCKGADGRITYSSLACPGEGETLSKSGVHTPATPPKAVEQKSPPATEAAPAKPTALPKCDNAVSLKSVVARLDSPATPDDVRNFLADERLRLLRCEFTRFTLEEMHERESAMSDLNSSDVARRRAAMTRMEALYERYMTAADRAARAANRQR
jgi:hypothetical protein